MDPKTRPCIFLGYGDDEFGCWLWNLAKKKVIQGRDIVFMEEKTIADRETDKKGSTSKSTSRDQLHEVRIHSFGSRMLAKEQNRLDGFGQRTESAEGVPNTGTRKDSESESDEEPTEEPVVENKGGYGFYMRTTHTN